MSASGPSGPLVLFGLRKNPIIFNKIRLDVSCELSADSLFNLTNWSFPNHQKTSELFRSANVYDSMSCQLLRSANICDCHVLSRVCFK